MLDWDINDVFNDSTTQQVNWHRHMTRGLTWLITTTRIWKVEPLANKVTRTKEIMWYQHAPTDSGYDEQTGGSICAHE